VAGHQPLGRQLTGIANQTATPPSARVLAEINGSLARIRRDCSSWRLQQPMVITATRRSTSSRPVIADPGNIRDQPQLERLDLKAPWRLPYVDQHPVDLQ